MIKREGHYILTLDDWNTIIKYFMLNPRTVAVKEAPDLIFTEYRLYDIYSKKVLLGFYDHDGMIRISDDNNTIKHTIDIYKILEKNPEPPSQQILETVKVKLHNHRAVAAKQVKDKIIEKTVGRKPSPKDDKK